MKTFRDHLGMCSIDQIIDRIVSFARLVLKKMQYFNFIHVVFNEVY